MDTAGAIVGPLSAAVFVLALHASPRTVFGLAGIPGLITILLAWFAVREVRPAARVKASQPGAPATAGGRPPRDLGNIAGA